MAKVRSPSVAYDVGAADTQRAKLFANGRSQAVRLPKAFRMPGTEVLIHREGNRIILEPIEEAPRDANGWPIGIWERIDALGGGEDFPDIEPMGAKLLEPEEIGPLDDEEAAARGLP
jgi:antitoxin VapB